MKPFSLAKEFMSIMDIGEEFAGANIGHASLLLCIDSVATPMMELSFEFQRV